jgi:hypothetical protein
MAMSNPPEDDDELLPGEDDLSDDEIAELDRPLLDVLGIEQNFAPDDLAPPVNERRLTAFVRDELAADQRTEVWELINSFQSWFQAWRALVARDADNGRTKKTES